MSTVFSAILLLLLSYIFVCVYTLPNIIEKDEQYNFTFVSREEWDALPSTDDTPLPTPVQYVVIHHTYIPAACYDRKSCIEAMKGMQRYHNSLGWGDIGYSFCIGSDGAAYEGRSWHTKGIHAGRANGVSVGICLIGDWRVNLPPQVQLETTKSLIAAGIELGYIKEDYKLVGHKQIMETECPGGALESEIKTWDHYWPIGPNDPLKSFRKNRT